MSDHGSRRSLPLPPGWEKIRARILKRDGHACQWRLPGGICGAPATDVDHTGDPGDHSDAHLRALCSPHHRQRSSWQAGTASGALRSRIAAARNRPREIHPGLIAKDAS